MVPAGKTGSLALLALRSALRSRVLMPNALRERCIMGAYANPGPVVPRVSNPATQTLCILPCRCDQGTYEVNVLVAGRGITRVPAIKASATDKANSKEEKERAKLAQ